MAGSMATPLRSVTLSSLLVPEELAVLTALADDGTTYRFVLLFFGIPGKKLADETAKEGAALITVTPQPCILSDIVE
uniref:Uncharacterized protein n=1 Tax=Rhodnius prolixus TaxID=13249 RepID=T1HRF1_RHOPR